MEETAYFAAGCFWGVEKSFDNINGIINTAVGYSGGDGIDANYQKICTGTTNHAEVVAIIFNPEIISYDKLLDIFWHCHNPTELNRQEIDIGRQYRSEIFYINVIQQRLTNISMQKLTASKKYNKPIVTAISPFDIFYMAEDYHQQYLKKNSIFNCDN